MILRKKLTIAYVSDSIWPYNKGGKEKRLFDITTRLAAMGYDVHIYTMNWWGGAEVIRENGVTLHAICKYHPLYSGANRSIKEGILFGLACLKLIKKNWDVIDVDHMPFFPLYSMKLVCLLKRKQMNATWHEAWGKNYWIKYMGKLGYISYIIERLSVFLPNKIISISDHTTKKLKKELNCKKEITTISIGVDLDNIKKIKPSDTKSDVVYVGRLLSHKNVNVLIKSIAGLKKELPKIKCLIIGDGPEREKLESLSNDLGLTQNIKFLGFVKEIDEVYALMKSSNVFVLPSTREGFGIVVIEANACGLPVIVINHPENAAKDLIKDGINGYVCELDEKDIFKKIIKVLKNSGNEITKQMCIKAVKKYDWDEVVNKIINFYSL